MAAYQEFCGWRQNCRIHGSTSSGHELHGPAYIWKPSAVLMILEDDFAVEARDMCLFNDRRICDVYTERFLFGSPYVYSQACEDSAKEPFSQICVQVCRKTSFQFTIYNVYDCRSSMASASVWSRISLLIAVSFSKSPVTLFRCFSRHCVWLSDTASAST